MASSISAESTLIFFFSIYYSWIEEITMTEDKGIFLLFGLKVVLDPADSFAFYFQLFSVTTFLAKCFDRTLFF